MTLHDEIAHVYGQLATGRYGLEAVSQLQHALQTAHRAERAGEGPSLVLAGLLHDVGHMVHKLGDNPAADGIDDKHETIGAKWLRKRLPLSVSEPVALHVAAKRYLCGAEPDYAAQLAPDSVLSLKLQGGPLDAAAQSAFLATPFAADAIRLRRYDDQAKVADAQTPSLEHYLALLPTVMTAAARKADLERDGFVVLRGFFGDADRTRLAQSSAAFGARAERILREAGAAGLAAHAKTNPNDLIVVAEADDPAKVCRFEYLIGADSVFADFVAKRIAPLISDLGGEAFLPFKDKENEKHPGGGAFGAHQDFAAYQAFGPRFNLTAMLSIDAATQANGCVAFAQNWREIAAQDACVAERVGGRPLFHFDDGGPKNGDIREDIAAQLRWTLVETEPGDLVVFDSFVPHRSERNGSSAPRRAMFLTFAPARDGDWYARYYADKRAHFDAPRFHVSTPTART
jgi:phosphonate degradation associated HDIG domain protein